MEFLPSLSIEIFISNFFPPSVKFSSSLQDIQDELHFSANTYPYSSIYRGRQVRKLALSLLHHLDSAS
ncbi:hypothetical protein OROHE_004546 [Orobanche hederae]